MPTTSDPSLDHIAAPLRALALPIDSLTLDPANARTHDEKNLAAIRGSLKRFGQRLPLVVQRQGMIVRAGNGRVMAARAMGWTHVACVVVDESEVEATAFAIADNRSSELGAWDDEALAKLLESLPDDAFAATGFGEDDLKDLLDKLAPATVEEDEVPEPQAEPVSRTGDLWVLGEHRLLCGDSTVEADVRRAMNGRQAALLACDPPYGVAYQSKLSVEEAVARRRRRDGLDLANDDLDANSTRALVRDALTIACAHLREGAAFYVCAPAGSSETGDLGLVFRSALRDAGLRLRQAIVWVKDVFVMGRQDYHWRHEDILYGWKEGAGHFFVEDRTQDTVWEIPRPKRSEDHPTMKPVALMARAITNSSRRGDLVYEPFSGSGTTLMACEQLSRRCAAVEIDGRFVDVAVRRWQAATGKEAVLEGAGRTFAAVEAERAPTREKAPESSGAEGEGDDAR